jgi:general secretion pathway protein I
MHEQALRRTAHAGFTLLEVLVAIMIVGMSLGAILHQFALASRAGAASHDVTRATLYAREMLEELKTQQYSVTAVERGSFDDGFEWETVVEPYGFDTLDDDAVFDAMRYETFRLIATVTWRVGSRTRQVELETLRTVRKRQWR